MEEEGSEGGNGCGGRGEVKEEVNAEEEGSEGRVKGGWREIMEKQKGRRVRKVGGVRRHGGIEVERNEEKEVIEK